MTDRIEVTNGRTKAHISADQVDFWAARGFKVPAAPVKKAPARRKAAEPKGDEE